MIIRENSSIKRKAENIIQFPEFYSKEQVKECYDLLRNDKRLSPDTIRSLLEKLKRVYKS